MRRRGYVGTESDMARLVVNAKAKAFRNKVIVYDRAQTPSSFALRCASLDSA
jgi:hypothetical protein